MTDQEHNEEEGPWYWCLKHQRAEPRTGCRAEDRLGPYDSPEAAQGWREKVEARNERWDKDDKRWEQRGR